MDRGFVVTDPDVTIRAPDAVEDHREWLRKRVSDLKNDGYEYFRAGFPDYDPRDVFLEGWKKQPKEMGPPPWERSDYVPREALVRPVFSSLAVSQTNDDLCLLDGSPVPRDGISHTRKMGDGQQNSYVVFSERKMRETPLVRPMRTKISHLRCGTVTQMHALIAATIARDPSFYKAAFCAKCARHFRVGSEGEFLWTASDQKVGT